MKTLAVNKNIVAVLLAIVGLVTFLCYYHTLSNRFTNWDDDVYVIRDNYITSFSLNNLKVIFTEDITRNNYHPLTMLSLAFNYHFSGLNPEMYYLTNVLIHIANTLLVFFLCASFCKMTGINAQKETLFISILSTLWFGIHPMHVESVSWISERKDVLYAFFYLSAMLTYIKYKSVSLRKWYYITLLLFIASCLSKPVAVVFPLSMVCIDFLSIIPFRGQGAEREKWNRSLLMEKIPFLIASLVFGLMAVYTQGKTGAIAPFSRLTIAERIMYATYGFDMYIFKFFVPIHQSTFYPYPYRFIDGWLPWIYYAAPFIAILIMIVIPAIFYRINKLYSTIAVFGLAFFFINIVFELQFISVGAALMADRYPYIAYLGLFFIVTFFIKELLIKTKTYVTGILILFALSAWLGYTCSKRTLVWHDSETLYGDAITRYPYQALLSYKWLGNYYLDSGRTDKALQCYNVLNTLHADDAKTDDNAGNICRDNNQYAKALEYYTQSLKHENNVIKTYLDLSHTYLLMGNKEEALNYINIALRLNPAMAEQMFSDMAFDFKDAKKDRDAIPMYSLLIEINHKNPLYYFYRGVCRFDSDSLKDAIGDFLTTMTLKPDNAYAAAAFNLAIAYDSTGNDSAALRYLAISRNAGLKINDSYFIKYNRKNELFNNHHI